MAYLYVPASRGPRVPPDPQPRPLPSLSLASHSRCTPLGGLRRTTHTVCLPMRLSATVAVRPPLYGTTEYESEWSAKSVPPQAAATSPTAMARTIRSDERDHRCHVID